MPPWVPVLISVGIFIAGASLGFVYRISREVTALRATHEAQYVAHSDMLKCIPDIQKQVAALAQNDEVFWKVIGPHMSGIIASPTHINRDHLINRLDEGLLTYDQALNLSSLLGHALEEEKDNTRKVALAFKLAQVRCLLVAMDRKQASEGEEVAHSCHSPISRMS